MVKTSCKKIDVRMSPKAELDTTERGPSSPL